MRKTLEERIEMREWITENLPLYKKNFPKHAYERMAPEFNRRFGTELNGTQLYSFYSKQMERVNNPSKAYKHSPLSRVYDPAGIKAFYDWLIAQEMASHESWEAKWLELTGKKLSYTSITQRLFQYGYRWKTKGECKSWKGRERHEIGDIIERNNTGDSRVKNKGRVHWIKVKNFNDLTEEEKERHIRFKRQLECSPCWKRYDRYVLERNGIFLKKGEYIVHLNGDTLDDSLENLYVTDNYWEYCQLKNKGLCESPSLVEACLETKRALRKTKEIQE